MLPKQKEIEVPLLEVLVELGGKANRRTSIRLSQRSFPRFVMRSLLKRCYLVEIGGLTGSNGQGKAFLRRAKWTVLPMVHGELLRKDGNVSVQVNPRFLYRVLWICTKTMKLHFVLSCWRDFKISRLAILSFLHEDCSKPMDLWI